MSIGMNLLVLPISIGEFKEKYSLEERELMKEYIRYLSVNAENHHYGIFKGRMHWLHNQLFMYRG